MAISGRVLLLAAVVLVLLVLFPSWSTVLLALAALVLLVFLDVALAALLKKLQFRRMLPQNVRLGEPCTSEVLVSNDSSRRLQGEMRDAWQPSAGAQKARQALDIPPSEQRKVSTTLLSTRRGELRTANLTVRAFGPLGLGARQRTFSAPASVKVLPPFHSKRHLPSKLKRLRELDGKAAVQIRGAGTEFDSLRDYVRGDDVRSIDWRATARRQSVVVRTWRPERDRRVIVVLDTSRLSAVRIDDEPHLDTGMEAALLLAVLAERGGDRVDFVAFDRRVRARTGSTAKGMLLKNLVQSMATLEPALIELDFSQIPQQVRAISSHRALVVLLTALDSGAPEEGLLPIVQQLAQDHVVVVASVRDPALDALLTERTTATQTYRAAAAERALLEREAISRQLRQMGAEVVDAAPLALPPLLADAYIRLKAAGRL
ncbi:DUF58 domain-containing protein [Pseudarthrobacter sp. J1763]|uniref:DUF58 domain-containing protein n=1 Tax=Pseudarthrobacter sp. J1763 TaxID=3420445 RepID=UPI003D2C9886